MKKFTEKLLIIFVLIISLVSLIKIIYPFINDQDENIIYNSVQKINNSTTTDDFSFVVMGDNKNSISTFSKIIKDVNNDDSIKFIINTGDMVFDGNPIKYSFFIKQIKTLNKPFLPVCGNHDVADGGTDKYNMLFGPLYYSFNTKNSYFIVLNNSNEENIDLWQMKWLIKKLNESKKFDHTFIFMHVPIFDPRVKMENQPGHSMKNLNNAKKLMSILKSYKIDKIFFGHIHGYYKGNFEGIPYIVTGGGGAELVGSNKNHDFYHYIKVTVKNNDVTYDVHKLNSPDFNFIDRVGAFLWLYLYAFIAINYWAIIFALSTLLILIIYLKNIKSKNNK
ncbi:metallophosphoesterase [Tepiditoga spiralis]|uniref:Metallophosphoesterase n=1 Tax=Tepiditoga spiralis TaxID=2108365 RepID=A0A7G1G413_9BACT|nr:metallophosphoesterase [Tepiditoga spiralis]BBE31208.1 metallophosphoesterase [Tepiditoga spiralis]